MRFVVSLLLATESEIQRKGNAKMLFKTNDRFISLAFLLYCHCNGNIGLH